MFGSLIIVLPSKFEGGQVHVSHGSSKDVFDISPSSESTTSALAWYTDVVHEVKPITSGYRLAISYNLVNIVPGLPPPHLPDMHAAVSVVERIFRRWKKGVYDFPDFHGTISYILDHQYTEAGLELAALKGKDAALVSNIRGVAEKQGVSLLLGLLEYEVSGDAGDNGGYDSESDSTPGMGIIHEQEYTIQGLYDLEGDLAEGMYPISLNPEYDLIPEDPEFDDQDPDDQEFEGYTGNVSFCPHTRTTPRTKPSYRKVHRSNIVSNSYFLHLLLSLTLGTRHHRVSSLCSVHVPGYRCVEHTVANGWYRVRVQEIEEMEGRRTNREEQKDGSIHHRPRRFVVYAPGTLAIGGRSHSGMGRFHHVARGDQ